MVGHEPEHGSGYGRLEHEIENHVGLVGRQVLPEETIEEYGYRNDPCEDRYGYGG